MTRSHIFRWLLPVLALCIASPAAAEWQDREIEQYGGDWRLFDKFDGTTFDEEPVAPHGFWVSFEIMTGLLLNPDGITIGNTDIGGQVVFDPINGGMRAAYNSLNTGFLESQNHDGQITEVGYINDDCGWFLRSWDLQGRNESFVGSAVNMVLFDPGNYVSSFVDFNNDGFDDDLNRNRVYGRDGVDTDVPPDGVPDAPFRVDFGDTVSLAIVFEHMEIHNRTDFWGVEANRLIRHDRLHHGGYLESFYGARYFLFDENFTLYGTGSPFLGTILSDLQLENKADNNLIYSQIGLRWFYSQARWTVSADVRGMLGVNVQSMRQYSVIGTNAFNLQRFGTGGSSNDALHETEFSGGLELGFNYQFHITRAFSLRAGYRALGLTSIARPAQTVRYALPDFGIEGDTTKPITYHSLTFGFDFNR